MSAACDEFTVYPYLIMPSKYPTHSRSAIAGTLRAGCGETASTFPRQGRR
jgi:hypothetical protein